MSMPTCVKICRNQLNLFPLQASLHKEQETFADLQKEYALAQECSEERRTKLEEAEKKIQQLQETLKG